MGSPTFRENYSRSRWRLVDFFSCLAPYNPSRFTPQNFSRVFGKSFLRAPSRGAQARPGFPIFFVAPPSFSSVRHPDSRLLESLFRFLWDLFDGRLFWVIPFVETGSFFSCPFP